MDIFEQNLTMQTSLAMVQTLFWGKISLSALCVHFHEKLHLISITFRSGCHCHKFCYRKHPLVLRNTLMLSLFGSSPN